MIALDALSAYWIMSHTDEERGLNVTLSSLGRNGLTSHVLQLNSRQSRGLQEQLQVSRTLAWVAVVPPGPTPGGQDSQHPPSPRSPPSSWP